MKLTKIIYAFFLLNLFFIGLMVGIAFVKQTPVSEHNLGLTHSFTNNKNLSSKEQLKVFSRRLKSAINLSVHNLYYRWKYLSHYPKGWSLLSNVESFMAVRIFDGGSTMDNSRVSTWTTKVPHRKLIHDSIVQDTAQLNLISGNNKLKKLAEPKLMDGRIDPFLTLGEKLPTETKPKIPEKSNTDTKLSEDKPEVAEKPLEEKPKVELKPVTDQKTEVVPKIDIDKEKAKLKMLTNYHLRGIVIGNSPVAYVEDQNGYRKVTVGDSFGEGKITEITETSVTIQFADGEQVVLNVEESK